MQSTGEDTGAGRPGRNCMEERFIALDVDVGEGGGEATAVQDDGGVLLELDERMGVAGLGVLVDFEKKVDMKAVLLP